MSATLTISLVTIIVISCVAVGVAADCVVAAIAARNAQVDLSPPPPPSDTEYEVAMALALRPFFAYLKSVNYQVNENDEVLISKIDETLASVVGMRLRSRNPAHLATVLLLEKWRRAVRGSAEDYGDVAQMTADLLEQYPWLEEVETGLPEGGGESGV